MDFPPCKKRQPADGGLSFLGLKLLFDNFEDFHGAGLGADAAGDALGGILGVFRVDHQTEGACFLTCAAVCAELLVDDVNTLGVLSDGTGRTCFRTLAALGTYHGLGYALAINDLDAGLIGMEFLVECLGTGLDALQASHTGGAFLYSQLFHSMYLTIILYFLFEQNYYTAVQSKNQSILFDLQ